MHLDDGALMWHSFQNRRHVKSTSHINDFLICNFHDSWYLPSNEYMFLLHPQEKGRLSPSPLPTHIIIFKQPYSWPTEVQKRWNFGSLNSGRIKQEKRISYSHSYPFQLILDSKFSSLQDFLPSLVVNPWFASLPITYDVDTLTAKSANTFALLLHVPV